MPPSKRRVARWAPPKVPATRPPLRRLLWALQRLRAGKPVRATDLAREFEVALRTEEVKVSPESLDAYLSLDLGPLYAPDAAVFRDVLAALRLRRRALVRYRSLSSGRTTSAAHPPVPRLQPARELVRGGLGREAAGRPRLRHPPPSAASRS